MATYQLLQKMESDLAALPLHFSNPKDFILVDNLPDSDFLNSLSSIGNNAPKFQLKKDIANEHFSELPRNKLVPWGWSPAVHKFLDPLKESCSEDFKKSPVFNWKPAYRELYSKKFALGILSELLEKYPNEYFISRDMQSEICIAKADFERLIDKWGKLMVKAPWSSSGRGLQPITFTPVHTKVWEKLLGIVKEQGYAIVEPFLNKKLDLAFQFKLKRGKAEFIGTSNFSADKKGQYQGNNLNGLPEELETDVKDFAEFIPQLIINPLKEQIEKSELAKSYEGYFGVDTLIYQDSKGKLKINPCLEINVRLNMGLLSLHLERIIHPEKKGVFRTYYKPGFSFKQFKIEMEQKHPLRISDKKIHSGFFALTPSNPKTQFGAYIIV